MQVSFTVMPADPIRLPEALRFLTEEGRPQVEGESGSLGMSLHENADLGIAVVESFWASAAEACDAERVVAPIRGEAARHAGATVSVERFEVATLVRSVRPHPGAGLRLTRFDTDPAGLDAAVAAYADTAVPWLAEVDGFCAALLYVDRDSGRSIGETVWRDANALAASRSAAAAIRATTVRAAGSVVRVVEEYRLVWTSLGAR